MTIIFAHVPSSKESPLALTLMLAAEALTFDYWHAGRYSRASVQALWNHLPYCWHPVADSDDLILLSRNYKPIGAVPRRIHVRYEDYPHLMAPREVIHSVDGFHRNQNPEEPARWFYDDGTAPWNGKRYAETLLKLIRANIAALEVEP